MSTFAERLNQPKHGPWIHDRQVADGISRFTERTVRFDQGLPVREPIDPPYHRWYCICGAIGGRSFTVEGSQAGLAMHVADPTGLPGHHSHYIGKASQ